MYPLAMHDIPLARLLLDAFRWFDEPLRRAQAERLGVNITSAQSLLFADLSSDGSRQADLARSIGVSRQAVNELVRGLERQGLVEAVPDPTDGRAKLVRPTRQGRKSIALAREVFTASEARLSEVIGESSVHELRAILCRSWESGAPR
jgi:DNA-binding MarR family transcriptional regulator